MTVELIYLGCCPTEEDAAQMGDPDYARDARAQCRAYIDAIRKVVGHEPDGARLYIKSELHDFGTYFEVVERYDGNDRKAAAYAQRCDAKVPTTWSEAGMMPPTSGRER